MGSVGCGEILRNQVKMEYYGGLRIWEMQCLLFGGVKLVRSAYATCMHVFPYQRAGEGKGREGKGRGGKG